MIIIEDIKNTLSKLTKTITKTSGELVKTTKLSVSLASEEDKLKSLYLEIGKKVHEIYLYGGTLGKFFDEKYVEITVLEKKIDELRNQIDTVKGTKTCGKCGKTMSYEAGFCPKCGAKANEGDITDKLAPNSHKIESQNLNLDIVNKSIEIEQNSSVKKCTACGHNNEAESKYCLSCGRKI